MSTLKTLNDEQQMELKVWLDSKNIQWDNRTRRRLSDVVEMVKLLNSIMKINPIDLNNYTSHCSLPGKVMNWECFSLRVLQRLDIHLSPSTFSKLASGDSQALQYLLYQLMFIDLHDKRSHHSIERMSRGKPTVAVKIEFQEKETQTDFDTRDKIIFDLTRELEMSKKQGKEQDNRIAQLMGYLATLSSNITIAQSNFKADIMSQEAFEF